MWKKILLVVCVGLAGALGLSCGRKEIPLAPLIRIPPGIKPWPFQAVLVIQPHTEHFHYWSPDTIPSRPSPNHESIRPFTLPLGRAFAGAAQAAFTPLFEGLSRQKEPTTGDGNSLVVEPVLEEFSLGMEYVSHGSGPHETFLEVQGKITARFRLKRPGKDPWEKRVASEIPATRLPVNPWTEEEIGKLAAAGLAALYNELLLEMLERPASPAPPLESWLSR